MKLEVKVNLVGEGVISRAKALLQGAPKHVANHRLSVGIHEQEASSQAVKIGENKPKPDQPKTNYRGHASNAAYLVDVALAHEFGTDVIPERSWLRSWFDQNLERLKNESAAAMRAEWKGDKEAVPALAAQWEKELREWISNDEAGLKPLKDSTKAARRAADLPEGPPLYALGQFVRAIHGQADGRYV